MTIEQKTSKFIFASHEASGEYIVYANCKTIIVTKNKKVWSALKRISKKLKEKPEAGCI